MTDETNEDITFPEQRGVTYSTNQFGEKVAIAHIEDIEIASQSQLKDYYDGVDSNEPDENSGLAKTLYPSLDLSDILSCTQLFMELAGQLDDKPDVTNKELRDFRFSLLSGSHGEHTEYTKAESTDDIVEIADGLLDVIVVAWGTLCAYFGPDIARMMAVEVNRSNLNKVLGPGLPIKNAAGKVLKPEGWVGPNIRGLMALNSNAYRGMLDYEEKMKNLEKASEYGTQSG